MRSRYGGTLPLKGRLGGPDRSAAVGKLGHYIGQGFAYGKSESALGGAGRLCQNTRMKHVILAAALAFATIAPATLRADGEAAGDFDYYVLALSWSPNWCKLEGNARGAEQCEEDFGWVVHGLWPQYEDGWPAYCNTVERPPSKQDTAAEADLFGAGGAAWYQWKKHGVCAGLPADAYFDTVRAAYESIERPEVLRKIDRTFKIPASLIEEAFIQVNPELEPDMITVTCRDGHIQEARICLTKDLEPRACAPDTRRDCTMSNALLEPIR